MPTVELLLHGLNQRWPHLFALNFGGVPRAAKRFHQINGCGHLLAEQLRCQAFVSEQRGLRGNHIEVGGDAANVTVVGEVERAATG